MADEGRPLAVQPLAVRRLINACQSIYELAGELVASGRPLFWVVGPSSARDGRLLITTDGMKIYVIAEINGRLSWRSLLPASLWEG